MRTATFALFACFVYVSLGLLGLIPAALTPPPADTPPSRINVLYGHVVGLFAVNVLLSLIHLATGIWGVLAWRSDHSGRARSGPKVYARVLAILYGALAVIGVIPGVNTLFGTLPLHGSNVWLHAGTAAIAAYFGWRSEAFVDRRADRVDRRQHPLPVQRERRLGHSDRRVPGSEV